MKFFLIYLILINIFAFMLMGMDKKRAQKGVWRISEKNLFLSTIVCGSIGAILGMKVFRHKTKHWYFRLGMPLILIIQIVVAAIFLTYI